MSEPSLDEFSETYNLKSIVNKLTCLKTPGADYKQEKLLKAKIVETRLPDFHKMVVSVFKISFKNKSRK